MLPRWLVLSALSALFYGASSVASYQMVSKRGVDSSVSLAMTDIFATLTFLAVFLLPGSVAGDSVRGLRRAAELALPAALGVAILFGVGDMFLNMSYKGSPNPGYCDSISDSEMVIAALITLFMFKAPVTKKQLAGMVLVVFSLYFLQA